MSFITPMVIFFRTLIVRLTQRRNSQGLQIAPFIPPCGNLLVNILGIVRRAARRRLDQVAPSFNLSDGDFPFKFFQQERVNPKAAQKQLSGMLRVLSAKTIKKDFDA